MAKAYIGVDGVARKIKKSYIGVDGIARKIKKVYIGDENGVAKEYYSSGKKLSEYTVGSSVYLNENGSPVEYLIVHQGLPDSTLYDSSCDGVWLLKKTVSDVHQWDSTNNDYINSDIHSYLNNEYLTLFDVSVKSIIKQVKIPYVNGTGSNAVSYGEQGLETRIFLLSGYELGWTNANSSKFPVDGAKLDYFISGTTASANSKRIAYQNNTQRLWWLRSAVTNNTSMAWYVDTDGTFETGTTGSNYRIRPALILPYTALVDEETNILIG